MLNAVDQIPKLPDTIPKILIKNTARFSWWFFTIAIIDGRNKNEKSASRSPKAGNISLLVVPIIELVFFVTVVDTLLTEFAVELLLVTMSVTAESREV